MKTVYYNSNLDFKLSSIKCRLIKISKVEKITGGVFDQKGN